MAVTLWQQFGVLLLLLYICNIIIIMQKSLNNVLIRVRVQEIILSDINSYRVDCNSLTSTTRTVYIFKLGPEGCERILLNTHKI